MLRSLVGSEMCIRDRFTASQESTARNCREFRPCQRRFLCIDRTVLRPCRYPSSPREAAAQFTASQETTARNCREFRPCDGLFFVHRPRSSQQSKKQSKKISEKKTSAVQVLKSEMRHICLQFSLSRPGGMREAIKITETMGCIQYPNKTPPNCILSGKVCGRLL